MKKWIVIASFITVLWLGVSALTANFNQEESQTTHTSTLTTPDIAHVAIKGKSDLLKGNTPALPIPPPKSTLILTEAIDLASSPCEPPKFSNSEEAVKQLTNMILNSENIEAVYGLLHHLRNTGIPSRVNRNIQQHTSDQKEQQRKSYIKHIEQNPKALKNWDTIIEEIESLPVKQRPAVGNELPNLTGKLELSEKNFDRLLNSEVVVDLNTLSQVSILAFSTKFKHKLNEKISKKLLTLPKHNSKKFINYEYIYSFLAVNQDIKTIEFYRDHGLDIKTISSEVSLPDLILEISYHYETNGDRAKKMGITINQGKSLDILQWLSSQNVLPSENQYLYHSSPETIPENLKTIKTEFLNNLAQFREDLIPGIYSNSIYSVIQKSGIEISLLNEFNEEMHQYHDCVEAHEKKLQRDRLLKKLARADFFDWIEKQRRKGHTENQIEESLSKVSIDYIHIKRVESHKKQLNTPPINRSDHAFESTRTIEKLEDAIILGEFSPSEISHFDLRHIIEKAMEEKNTDNLEKLIDLGFSVNHFYQPLVWSLEKPNFKDFELLDRLYSMGISYDYAYLEFRPFFTAIQNDNLELAEYIHKKGATLGSERFLEDPLSYTLKNYKPEKKKTLEYLINIGFPIHKQHRDLYKAAKKSSRGIPKLPD